jgi:hypothetical protein
MQLDRACRQRIRFSNNETSIVCNADMRVGEIRQFCKLQDEGGALTTVGSVEVSATDAGGDEPDAVIGAGLSSHLETSENDGGSGGV